MPSVPASIDETNAPLHHLLTEVSSGLCIFWVVSSAGAAEDCDLPDRIAL